MQTAISDNTRFKLGFASVLALALAGAMALGASPASATHLVGGPIEEGHDDAYGEAVCFVNGAAGIAAANPVDSLVHDAQDDDEAFDPATNLNDTDGGNFGFTTEEAGSVVCAGADEGGESIGALASTDFRIDAGVDSRVGDAEYTNLVCATGHAEGSADLFTPGTTPAELAALSLGAGQHATDLKTHFSIDFAAGTGPLAITGFEGHVALAPPPLVQGPLDGMGDPDENPGTDVPDRVQDVDTGFGTGVVEITAPTGVEGANPPNPDENPPGGDTGGPGGPIPATPFDIPCLDKDVVGFEVFAAFTATLSGDADVGNDDDED